MIVEQTFGETETYFARDHACKAHVGLQNVSTPTIFGSISHIVHRSDGGLSQNPVRIGRAAGYLPVELPRIPMPATNADPGVATLFILLYCEWMARGAVESRPLRKASFLQSKGI
jgi:hypothetical protein